MNALIVGGGLVGSELAHMLAEAGITMSVIEQSEERCDLIEPGLNELGVRVFCGDGDEPAILEEAEIASADVVVAATGDDEDNLVVCLLAKNEYAVGLTLARVNNPKNAWLFTEAFGVDVPISQTTMIAELLRKQVPGDDQV